MNTVPDQILVDINNEHLPYEIGMLRESFRRWVQFAQTIKGPLTPDQAFTRNSLIETFCVHARALLDFFSDRRTDQTDAIASDFTNGYVATFDPTKEPIKSVRTKLNKQLFHLTRNRTVIGADKFNMYTDGTLVLQTIEPAIQEFASHLTPDFRGFRCNTPPITFPTPTISASSVLGATGTISLARG